MKPSKATNDDEKIGVDIIKRAVEGPLRSLAANAGVEGSLIVQEVKKRKGNEGYNVATGEYEDLVKAGVVDPKKVTRSRAAERGVHRGPACSRPNASSPSCRKRTSQPRWAAVTAAAWVAWAAWAVTKMVGLTCRSANGGAAAPPYRKIQTRLEEIPAAFLFEKNYENISRNCDGCIRFGTLVTFVQQWLKSQQKSVVLLLRAF